MIHKSFKFLIGIFPATVAMYSLYWLETSGTWTPEMPHRDKITIAIMLAGMSASYCVFSWFIKRASATPKT